MNDTTTTQWQRVRAALDDATGIAWDGCHKCYVLMDEEQMDLMDSYGYDPLLRVTEPDEALEILKDWFYESCALRFISAVRTTGNPNDGFTNLIAQFEDEEDES